MFIFVQFAFLFIPMSNPRNLCAHICIRCFIQSRRERQYVKEHDKRKGKINKHRAYEKFSDFVLEN